MIAHTRASNKTMGKNEQPLACVAISSNYTQAGKHFMEHWKTGKMQEWQRKNKLHRTQIS